MIIINLDKAKVIAHDIRRQARAEEFAPYDEVIAKRIPGVAMDQAEAARQQIRDKYVLVQADIDNASSPEQIKEVLDQIMVKAE